MPLPTGTTFLLRRVDARQRARAERTRLLREGAEAAAVLLSERLGATRVALFGSVARGAADEDSDVDLAVWGIRPEDEASAIDLVEEAVRAPVDLIRMENAPPSMQRRVEKDGVILVPRA